MNEWTWNPAEIGSGVLQNKFIIVIPCYNAEDTIEMAVLTVLKQDFDDLAIIIRNDRSTDHTGEIIHKIFNVKDSGNFYIKSDGRDIIYIENTKKLYGGGNTYESVITYAGDPNSIVGVVDGDDFLIVENAVSIMYEAYQDNPDKWLIWSQHVSREQLKKNFAGYSFPLPPDGYIYHSRRYWAVSHFRTCLAGLFYLIDPTDLSDPYDKTSYAKICGDAAIMYPITEMCGNKHSMFLNQSLYYYNDGIPTNDAELYQADLQFYKNYFESKQIYQPLPPDHKF